MIAGIFAFMPVEQASTVHDTIIAVMGTPTVTITNDIEDLRDQIDDLVQVGFCSQAATDTDASFTCNTAMFDGIMYVIIDTTNDGGDNAGVHIEIDGVDDCQDVLVLIADSPFLCVTDVLADEVITLVDAANDDAIATAEIIIVSAPVDPT